jgi:phthiocerol/phenolphthiocerol synthesis type-I polyketide synthase E
MENDNTLNEQNNFDIAIIGMSGRFPGAKSIDEFWQNLCAGIESVTFFSDEELRESGIDPAALSDPSYVKASAILDGPELFDASFFGYSPREAEIMDPQHRLFLECAWEAMENAGYDADRYDGPIGVYAGTSRNTYLLHNGPLADYAASDLSAIIGSDKDFLTMRVSYKLNLTGPSVTIQTACSTSLVAIHMACQSLLNEECDMALAGGVSVRVPHKAGYFYRQGGIPSPDGHCRAFDARGQGTLFGSGVGVVLLKRLSDAIADGDCIQAIIKGSAINNDGNLKVGYTAPGINGESEVILKALANAGVEADTISYIEAHGTGTALGCPIEIAALTKAYRNYTDETGFCAIGSVKTNIGHLDAAAGIAGFIKTALALKHKMIPPILHFEKANPEIDFPNSPFYVNTQLLEWKTDDIPRRAGVSSFGIGGTNAHVIMEEAPHVEVSGKSRPRKLLLLSAKTSSALETATANLVDHLKHHPDLNLADVAYTLQSGRKVFNHRRMVVCQDYDDAVNSLETLEPNLVLTSFQEPIDRDVVFIFSGQGSQYVNMGLELYKTEPVFREQVDRCSEILQPHLGLDLRDILYPDESDVEGAREQLTQTYITQPALFTIEYALAKLWMAWGVRPEALAGHSIGEYVAACLAGVFTLQEGLSLVAARGRLIQELDGGSMLAVFLSEKEIQPLLGERLSLAVINGPSLCVVSGEKEDIKNLENRLNNEKTPCRYLHTSHAYHSKMVEPILDTFAEKIKQVSLSAPQIPFVSNVTGTWIKTDEAMSPDYWVKHLRQTVRFSDCIEELLKEPNRVLLEVGPGRTFSTLVGQHPSKTEKQVVLSSTRHPKEEKSDVAFILNTLGQLWLAGVPVDWSGFYRDESRHRLPLPTYPFERQRYWIEAGEKAFLTPSSVPSLPEEPQRVAYSNSTSIGQETGNAYDVADIGIEQTIAKIWQEALGIKQVNYHDDFFDLGGTSLIAVHLFTEIDKIFGKKLPLATLYTAPTVEQLAGILRNDKWTGDWKPLVEMQPGSAKPPLFFIHAAGGNVLIYHDLIHHLDLEQPVYGLQAKGLDGKHPFHTRIEDMAAQYVQEVQTVQPEGPYLLAGYCMGGTVALEMAQQLRAQGQEVALLALFETYNWANMPAKSFLDKVYYYIQKIQFNWGKFLLSKSKLSFIMEKKRIFASRSNAWLRSISSKLGHKIRLGNEQDLILSRLRRTNDLAANTYLPKAYPGRITHFIPAKEYSWKKRPGLGWEKMAAGGVEFYELPVYPEEMFKEPFTELLAEKLKICIQKASEPKPSNRI